MELSIDGQTQTLQPLADFRKQWGLPATFGMAHFEPEERTGLGKLEEAGDTLNQIKNTTLKSVAPMVSRSQLFDEAARLAYYFQQTLTTHNHQIGLSLVEIDFARAGFEDILRAVTDQLVRLSYETTPAQICQQFNFPMIYETWLNNGVRVASTEHHFVHDDRLFLVQVIYNPYGRMGLRITVDDQTSYVLDTTFACPAASYMKSLSETVAQKFCEAFAQGLA